MDIKELQEKIKKADKDRGWDVSFLSQTFTHLIEEMGEIGRHILFRDGTKLEIYLEKLMMKSLVKNLQMQ